MAEQSREQQKRKRNQIETEESFLRQEEDRSKIKRSRSLDSLIRHRQNKRKRNQFESENSFLKQEEDRSNIKRSKSLSSLSDYPKKRKRNQVESETTFLEEEDGRNKRFKPKSPDIILAKQAKKKKKKKEQLKSERTQSPRIQQTSTPINYPICKYQPPVIPIQLRSEEVKLPLVQRTPTPIVYPISEYQPPVIPTPLNLSLIQLKSEEIKSSIVQRTPTPINYPLCEYQPPASEDTKPPTIQRVPTPISYPICEYQPPPASEETKPPTIQRVPTPISYPICEYQPPVSEEVRLPIVPLTHTPTSYPICEYQPPVSEEIKPPVVQRTSTPTIHPISEYQTPVVPIPLNLSPIPKPRARPLQVGTVPKLTPITQQTANTHVLSRISKHPPKARSPKVWTFPNLIPTPRPRQRLAVVWKPPILETQEPTDTPTPGIEGPNQQSPNSTITMDHQNQPPAPPLGGQPNQMMNLGTGKCQPRTFANDQSKGESWLVFRVHFKHVAKLNDWNDRQARFYLASCMVGDAGQAVLHIPTEIHNPATDTLERLLDQYQEIFLPPAQSETAKLQFEHMEQGPNESILHYASKMRCLYLHAYNDPNSESSIILIRRFLYGLRNPAVQFKVMESSPTTFASAIATAVQYTSLKEVQAMMQGGKNMQSSTAGNGVYQIIQNEARRGTPTQGGVNAIQENQRPRTGYNLSQMQCYQCGNRGHLARNCFQRRNGGNRGRGRNFRRPMSRGRPLGRQPNGQFGGGRNNWNRNRNVGSGSVNSITREDDEEVDQKIHQLQEQIAVLELQRKNEPDVYQELSVEDY